MFNKKVRLMTAMILSMTLLLSGCEGDTETASETTAEAAVSQTSGETATTAETTTEATTAATTATTTETETETTQERELTPEEVNLMNDMPDIVFILSHIGVENNSNLQGFFITKNGDIKMYSFDDSEWGKYIDIVDLYDELESAVCTSMEFHGKKFANDNLDSAVISQIKLIEQYDKLLLVNKNAEINEYGNPADVVCGYYNLYGIRTGQNGAEEFIYLNGWGDVYKVNTDEYVREICSDIITDNIFPKVDIEVGEWK